MSSPLRSHVDIFKSCQVCEPECHFGHVLRACAVGARTGKQRLQVHLSGWLPCEWAASPPRTRALQLLPGPQAAPLAHTALGAAWGNL